MKYFLIAGEASGDLHAASLITQLQSLDSNARMAGLGGDRMAAAGCRLYQDYRHMAFMGFAAVLRNMHAIQRNFRIAEQALLEEQPDVLILIDYPSFNLRIASFCRRHLPQTKIIYYIPPKVWAWKRWRIHKIARLCDAVLGIFPFEPAFYAKYGYSCTYVGNPTAEQIAHLTENSPAPVNDSYIAILPGSRLSEVTHCLPRMLEAARRFPEYKIVVTAAPGLENGFYTPYMREGETLSRDTYATVRNAKAAIINSGTATLETALIGCPQVAVYHLAWSKLIGLLRPVMQNWIFSIPYFTLVNILAGEKVIKELVADDFTTDKVAEELGRLLHDQTYQKNMLAAYEHIHYVLGESSASLNAARIITNSSISCDGKSVL